MLTEREQQAFEEVPAVIVPQPNEMLDGLRPYVVPPVLKAAPHSRAVDRGMQSALSHPLEHSLLGLELGDTAVDHLVQRRHGSLELIERQQSIRMQVPAVAEQALLHLLLARPSEIALGLVLPDAGGLVAQAVVGCALDWIALAWIELPDALIVIPLQRRANPTPARRYQLLPSLPTLHLHDLSLLIGLLHGL